MDEASLMEKEADYGTLEAFKEAINELKQIDNVQTERRKVALLLLRLREYNRAMSFLLRSRRKRVLGAKSAIDRTELTRQNLLYERQHLEATIEDARRHESLYLTVPLEDGDPVETQLCTEHEMMIHRLRHELETRKRMADRLKAGQDSLELARSRLVLKRKELEKLRDQLEMVIKAADPFLHSHARFFTDIEKQAQEQAEEEEEEESVTNTPLDLLYKHILNFSEARPNIKVYYFEKADGRLESDEPVDIDDDDEASATIGLDDTKVTTRSHARFTSHIQSVTRKYPFPYLAAELDSIRLYFYHVDGQNSTTPIVVKIEIADRELTAAEAESLLLTLDMDAALLLTVPNEAIVIGEAGHVPLRWLQSLVGLSSESFGDPQSSLATFFSAVEKRCAIFNESAKESQMQVDESTHE
jgi:hypothetical protein